MVTKSRRSNLIYCLQGRLHGICINAQSISKEVRLGRSNLIYCLLDHLHGICINALSILMEFRSGPLDLIMCLLGWFNCIWFLKSEWTFDQADEPSIYASLVPFSDSFNSHNENYEHWIRSTQPHYVAREIFDPNLFPYYIMGSTFYGDDFEGCVKLEIQMCWRSTRWSLPRLLILLLM